MQLALQHLLALCAQRLCWVGHVGSAGWAMRSNLQRSLSLKCLASRLAHCFSSKITRFLASAGDYWPGEAENLLASINSEASQGGKGAAPSVKGSSSRRCVCRLGAVLAEGHFCVCACCSLASLFAPHLPTGTALVLLLQLEPAARGQAGRSLHLIVACTHAALTRAPSFHPMPLLCSKPLKGKRAGPASGSPTEEAFRRLGDAIQVRALTRVALPCRDCRQLLPSAAPWSVSHLLCRASCGL